MAPAKSGKRLVFANFRAGEDGAAEMVNSPMAVRARQAFADPGAYRTIAADLEESGRPYCAECMEKPIPYGLWQVAGDIRALDSRSAMGRLTPDFLTRWE